MVKPLNFKKVTKKENSNNSIIPIGSTHLVRVGRSLQITNKILGEIHTSNNEWWKSLSPEWQKVIYANYIIQKEFKQEYIPYSAYKGDRNEKIKVLRKYEELYNTKLVSKEGISQKELNDILEIELLDCCNTPFNDYSPLNKLTNLKKLFLNGSSITNFEQIRKTLMNIEELEFNNTLISNISALEKSKNLERLSFYDTNVTDISPLKHVLKLKSLNCSNNKIKDISSLKDLTNLWWLDCNNTEIDEIESLSKLPIQKLWISKTKVKDLKPLLSLKQSLYWLLINDCEIGDEANVVLSQLSLGWLIISNTKITNLLFIKGYWKLERLDINNTRIRDISPLYSLNNLVQFGCSDVSLIKGQLVELGKINPSCKIYN